MIEAYHFGLIIIDGKTYNCDVEVRWVGEVLAWQREQSHIIDVKDVKRAIEQMPEALIIGTGEAGVAQLTETAKKAIEEQGIRLIVKNTAEAVKTFNIESQGVQSKAESQSKAIGLFHLTC